MLVYALVDFILDLLSSVTQKNCRVVITGRHLGSRTLQGVKESHVDQGRFGEFQPRGTVSGETEVGILVDGAWNQTRDAACLLFVLSKDMRERGCK